MNSATEAIPRKTNGNGKRVGGSTATASSATRGRNVNNVKVGDCVLWKKYSTSSPNAWKTHPTDSKDGTTKPFEFSNSRKSAPYSGTNSAFANLTKKAKLANKKVKKTKRQLKHAKRHGKRSKREYYSSSSRSQFRFEQQIG